VTRAWHKLAPGRVIARRDAVERELQCSQRMGSAFVAVVALTTLSACGARSAGLWDGPAPDPVPPVEWERRDGATPVPPDERERSDAGVLIAPTCSDAPTGFRACGDGVFGQLQAMDGITCRAVCAEAGRTCVQREEQASYNACSGTSRVSGTCDDVFGFNWSSQCRCGPCEAEVPAVALVQPYDPAQPLNYIGLPAEAAQDWVVGAKVQVADQVHTIAEIRPAFGVDAPSGSVASFDIVVLVERPTAMRPTGTRVLYLGLDG
jgi:hypothetical protein